MSSSDAVGSAGASSLSGAKITTSAISAGTPIALNSASTTATATAIRAIGASGQATQVRVVMPTNLMAAAPSMIKQIESVAAAAAASGRTQITAVSAAARTVSNTSITVARPITQTAYLPRASVTATQMTGVGVATTATGQRLVAPIRATPASGLQSATVTGLTAGGSFVRSATAGTTVSRNSASPSTTVISPASSTTWMAANTVGQVQLIRAISHPPRQRIITTQSLNTAGAGGGSSGGVLSGTVVSAIPIGSASAIPGNAATSTQSAQQSQQQQQAQTGSGQSTLQSVVSSAAVHTSQPQQQPTYVATLATVLPPRQHQATLVYSSNVGNATIVSAGATPAGTVTQTLAQTQPFSPTLATGQRFAVATSLTAAASNAAGAPRQIRQIPLTKQISTTKLSTASISIRAPNLPQLAPTLATATASGLAGVAGGVTATVGAITSATATVTARSGTVTGVAGTTATANVIPGGNLSTTRIIQLQQQPGGTAQQIIGSTGRLAGNVMLQPFIVNTTGGNKIGLRPPVTMAAKGQPSLTITHMGISKLPTTITGATIGTGTQAQTVAASLQGLSQGSVAAGASNLSVSSPLTSATGGVLAATPTSVGGGSGNVVSSATSATTNLSSSGGLLTAQNIVSSAAGGATVVPLAITTRGGTLTSIKNANGITVGKVMTPTVTAVGVAPDGNGTSTTAGTNLFIQQQQQQQQRPGSAGLNNVTLASAASSSASIGSTPSSNASAAVATSSAAFLPPGSTIYYESVPASTVQASTGVLSITTTTLTNSTMSQQQTSIAASSTSSALGITSSSFVTHAANTAASFTVVPSSGSGPRTIGQLQLPISSSSNGVGAQLQAVRFSAPLTAAAVTDSSTVSAQQQQVLMAAQVSGCTTAIGSGVTTPQHMVIPLQTSIKVTTAGAPGSTVVSNFLRKRDNAGSSDGSLPIRAAKNLAPTLLSMGAAPAASSPSSVSSTSSTLGGTITVASTAPASAANVLPQSLSPAPSTSSSFSTVSSSGFGSINASGTPGQSINATTALTVEALAKKDRAAALASTPSRCSRGVSPASSEGSTTVSANSSPGVEQQIAQDENGGLVIMQNNNNRRGENNNTHFNPIHELYPNHHQQQHKQHQSMMSDGIQQQQQHGTMQQSHGQRNPLDNQPYHLGAGVASSSSSAVPIANIPQRLNGGIEGPPRKRSRRGTNDSQQSNQSQPSSSFSLPPPAGAGLGVEYNTTVSSGNAGVQSDDMFSSNNTHTSTNQHKAHVPPQQTGNKENAKPVEYFLRRPRNCTLISTYKANWKAANNHFQRYTDVKQREDRRPTVIDVANQVNIQNKLGGWKVYHLRAQMEDLAENEESSYDHLNEMLKQMETHVKTSDTERICDLLKGNIQRNKIIVDGINEAKNQIMKIFDHQTHVSDILSRCASKRNFKKRDKV